jgi:hypothetical protein
MYKLSASNAINPGKPFDEELAGAVFDSTILAEKLARVTVLTEALPEGSLSIKILSVGATLAAVGNCETLFPLLAIFHQLSCNC